MVSAHPRGWLQYTRVEIDLLPEDGEVVTAAQFADDYEVVRQGMNTVFDCVECMDVYARTAGEQLNLDKVVVPVGTIAAPAGSLQGMRVGSSATALDFFLTHTKPVVARAIQMDNVWSCFERIVSLYLFVFGRATAASA